VNYEQFLIAVIVACVAIAVVLAWRSGR